MALVPSFSADIAKLDGYTIIDGGWLNHNWVQLGKQLADATAGMSWSSFITLVILLAMEGFTYLRGKRRGPGSLLVTDATCISEYVAGSM
ncbi:hypothetical protein GP486_006232 [Trichoglossum hirsutum]|uniref:Uncharacterized protein n=1 Tax=Trichoglossum hirsutum TaxID=265104 RepID=A0A9P8IK93_9PEZI|nr:hypothetical protein GP486_006232 [Trichoglossum hirsutum]